MILQLVVENHRLRQELNELKCQKSLLDDDIVLDSIEQSFHQFHAFLDMLRDAGSVSVSAVCQN